MLSVRSHNTFLTKVRNFPDEVYHFNSDDHLTKLMRTLLEDPGVGSLHKIQTVSRLSQTLSGTRYADLDSFFGVYFHIHRYPEEMYEYDPYSEELTPQQWNEIETKDGSYRERIRLFLSSFQRGGTVAGLAMAAEAACGYPCQILEVWRYIGNVGLSVTPGRLPTASVKEVVVVPKTPLLSPSRRKSIYRVLDRLKPANSFITVDENGLALRSPIKIRHTASPSQYFEIEKLVTGVDLPPVPETQPGGWIQETQEVAGRSLAFLTRQEFRGSLNSSLVNVEAFSLKADTYEVLPSRVTESPGVWGPWRDVEKSDSPDNYPNGKYAGSTGRYDQNGDYLFPYLSQSDYENKLRTKILALGGEFDGVRWRLPVTVESAPISSNVKDCLLESQVEVVTGWYP